MRGQLYKDYTKHQKVIRALPICVFSFIGVVEMIIASYFLRQQVLHLRIGLMVIAFYLLLNILVTTFQLNFYDPGYVLQQNCNQQQLDSETIETSPLYCQICKSSRPERSHHCKVCNKCVQVMDHHCFVFNQCISYYSYGYFFKFFIVTSIFLVFTSLCVIPGFLFSIKSIQSEIRYLLECVISGAIMIFGTFFGIVIGFLCIGMCYFPVCLGTTSIDKLQDYVGVKRSLKQNLQDYLGKNWFIKIFIIGVKMQ